MMMMCVLVVDSIGLSVRFAYMRATSELKLFLTLNMLEKRRRKKKKRRHRTRKRDIQLHIVEGNHSNGFSRFISQKLYRIYIFRVST